MKKKISLLLSLVLGLSVLAGCGEKKEEIEMSGDITVNFADYKESEDIPSWTGKKIKLDMWVDADSPNAYSQRKGSSDDVVSPEFERITGVSFDADESFDNAGNSFDAKIAQIVAAGNYPAMAYQIPDLSNVVKSGALWELSGYIEKYCPNVMKLFGPDTYFGSVWKEQMVLYGGVDAFQTANRDNNVRKMEEMGPIYNLTQEEIDNICPPDQSSYGYFFVRDDILKMVYPEAHTVAELEAIYEKNGKFTKEEIFDVPIDEPQDFLDLLYKVHELDIPDDGMGPVYTTHTHNGSDNWAACTVMLPVFGYGGQYFNYYDVQEKTMKYTFKQDWFKEIIKTYNKLIREGISSKESLIDTKQGFEEKYNNGRYLISTYSYHPAGQATNKYKYRKVYCRYTSADDMILKVSSDTRKNMRISFFKEGISEEDLIQALRAFDFACSPAGQKLIYWGPKSAGLYTEDENGKLQYIDENLANQMRDGGTFGDELVRKYGLGAGPWPRRFYVAASGYNPKRFYGKKLSLEAAFNPAQVDAGLYPTISNLDIYSVTSEIPGVKTFWSARNTFEDALAQLFAASSDEEFEARYKALIELSERNGLTDETLKQFNDLFAETNKQNMEELDMYIKRVTSK